MTKENDKYLWEFSKNLLVPPHQVKVAKECAKTIWLDRICEIIVKKAEHPEPQGYVGHNSYCLYYLTEESAKADYEKFQKEEDEGILKLSPDYIKKQAVKDFAEKLKAEFTKSNYHVLAIKDKIDKLFETIYEVTE